MGREHLGQRSLILSGYGSKCPKCDGTAVGICRCPLVDTVCANGHRWHECAVHGLVPVGARHDGKGLKGCTCDDESIEGAESGST